MSNNMKHHGKHNQIKYRRYQLTYPHEGSIIHSSKSKANAIKKCYKEFKRLNGINDGLFSVTDLDNKIEYQFKVRHNKIIKISDSSNMQMGGGQISGLTDSPLTPKLVSAKDNVKNNDLMQHIREPVVLTNNVSTVLPTMHPLITTPPELQQGSAAPNLPEHVKPPILPVSTDIADPQTLRVSQDTIEKVSEYKHETKDKIEELERLIEQKLQLQQQQFEKQLAKHKDQIVTLQDQLARQQTELKSQYQNIDKKMGTIIENTKENTELPELPKMGERTKEQVDQKIYEICDQLDELNKKDEDECVII